VFRDVSPLFPSGAERSALLATSPPSESVALGSGAPLVVAAPPATASPSSTGPVGVEICCRCGLVYAADLTNGLCECCTERLLDLSLALARGDMAVES
jgi:hypothetical protein